MLLKELIEVYEQLELRNEVKTGWDAKRAVHFGIDVDNNGKILQIIPFSVDKSIKLMSVPATTEKETGSGNFDKFIFGSSRYLLGFDVKKRTERHDSFMNTLEYHKEVLAQTESEAADAINHYFNYYADHFEELIDIVKSGDLKKYETSMFVLCYKGVPVMEYPEIAEAWNRQFKKLMAKEDAISGISLISGERCTIAKTHSGVSVPGGTNPSLVSFNADAFESYGWKQSYNSSISVKENLMYTTALNYLLKTEGFHNRLGETSVVMWSETLNPTETSILDAYFNGLSDEQAFSQDELNAIVDQIVRGDKNVIIHLAGQEIVPSDKFFITGLKANSGRVKLEFFIESTFGEFIINISKHYERLRLNDEHAFNNMKPYYLLAETVRDIKKQNKNLVDKLSEGLLQSILNNSNYPDAIYYGTLDRLKKEGPKTSKFQILKMYLSKNYWLQTKEVTGLNLNKEAKSIAYQSGRLFAVIEKLQKDASDGSKTSERYFASAMTTPSVAFAKLMRLNQYYSKKLSEGSKVYYDRMVTEIMNRIREFPKHFNLIEQGEFSLGYYHQKAELYTKKED